MEVLWQAQIQSQKILIKNVAFINIDSRIKGSLQMEIAFIKNF